MTTLDKTISDAFLSEGQQAAVNKVYLTLLKTTLFLPVKQDTQQNAEQNKNLDEPFTPLFAKIDEKYFLMAFDQLQRLEAWAGEHRDQMGYVELSGKYLIQGINEEKVYLGLNTGTECYKEFSPDEIKRLKTVAARIDQLRQSQSGSESESVIVQRFK